MLLHGEDQAVSVACSLGHTGAHCNFTVKGCLVFYADISKLSELSRALGLTESSGTSRLKQKVCASKPRAGGKEISTGHPNG